MRRQQPLLVALVTAATGTTAAAAVAAPSRCLLQPSARCASPVCVDQPQLTPAQLTPWAAAREAWGCDSFHEFATRVRRRHGDVVFMDLWPVLPRTYLLQGPEANRMVLSDLDPSLEQILQELINVLPIDSRVPSEVDTVLQKQVATLFQSQEIVNQRLPAFIATATRLRDAWTLSAAEGETPGAGEAAAASARSGRPSLAVFSELSEYVLRADLEVRALHASPSAHIACAPGSPGQGQGQSPFTLILTRTLTLTLTLALALTITRHPSLFTLHPPHPHPHPHPHPPPSPSPSPSLPPTPSPTP